MTVVHYFNCYFLFSALRQLKKKVKCITTTGKYFLLLGCMFFTANVTWLTGPCSERRDGWRGFSARWSHPQRFDPCLPPKKDIRNRRQSFYWRSFNSDLHMDYAACYCSFESLVIFFDTCVLTAVRGGGGGKGFLAFFIAHNFRGIHWHVHFITESQLLFFLLYSYIFFA